MARRKGSIIVPVVSLEWSLAPMCGQRPGLGANMVAELTVGSGEGPDTQVWSGAWPTSVGEEDLGTFLPPPSQQE